MKKMYHWFPKILLVACFIALTVSLGFYAWSIPGVKRTIALATTVQPESYTELYFDDHTQLPSLVVPGKIYTFSFTIHNLENRDMLYSYDTYVSAGGLRLLIDKDTVSIKNNESKTIRESFMVTSVPPRSQVVVAIVNRNQQIDFWIEGAK